MTTDLWPLALQAAQALGAIYTPVMARVAKELVPEWRGWLFAAFTLEPEPVSAAALRIRTPYAAAEAFEQRLQEAAGKGLLTTLGEGQYHLTDKAKRAAWEIIQAAYREISALEPMARYDLLHLVSLLQRLVQASLTAAEPPGKWCLLHSRRTDPGAHAALAVRIDQYLTDLAAYRDDAHMAAWCPYGVGGETWEAFTLLWREEAATLDELFDKLAGRGHPRERYAQALEDLLRRGWLAEAARQYRLTPDGLALREEAEATTDRYFYRPWVALGQDELQELRCLLQRFEQGMQAV